MLAGTTLEGVTVKAKTKSHEQVLDEKYASGLFSGGNSKQFDVEADPASQAAISVLSYLQEKLRDFRFLQDLTVAHKIRHRGEAERPISI